MAPQRLQRHRRIYRAMLALQPRAFRREYGELMLQLFTDQMRDAPSPMRVWRATAKDLAISVSYERTEESMKGYLMALLGAAVATAGLVGVITGRRPDGPNIAVLGLGLIFVVGVGAVFMARRSVERPSMAGVGGVAVANGSMVRHLKWLAIPVAIPGLITGFFGLAWGVLGLGVASMAILALSAVIWRVFGGRL